MLKINLRLLTSAVVSILCSAGILYFQKTQLNNSIYAKKSVNYYQQEKILESEANLIKKMPTFGFDNLIADWTFLKYVQYFGDAEARKVTGYSLVTDYFEVGVAKDPRFTQSFLSFSAANSLFAGQPQKTVKLINQVLESATPDLPGYPFLLWTYKATDEILFLGNLGAAKNSYEQAAEWANMRNDDLGKELSSRYLATAKFLASNPNSTDAQIGAWANVLNQAQDLKTQQHAIQQLEQLGAEVSVTKEGEIKITRPEKA
jgi:hypothetical protein